VEAVAAQETGEGEVTDGAGKRKCRGEVARIGEQLVGEVRVAQRRRVLAENPVEHPALQLAVGHRG